MKKNQAIYLIIQMTLKINNIYISLLAGLFKTSPFSLNLEPWQAQSQLCYASFHFSAQPRCEHLFGVMLSKLVTVSNPLINNCGLKILREGVKTLSNSFCTPHTISDSIIAESIAPVIPHLLKPVAAYQFVLVFEYLPI